MISNRFDILSELNLSFVSGDVAWGAALSGAAWYDTIYNGFTDAPGVTPPSVYPTAVRFAKAVRDLHGRDADLLNAYAYETSAVAGMPLTLRVGRHTVLWGESLFFAGNGIAAGQAPVDAIKALSVPVARAKEIYMPVGQISMSLQPAPDVTLSAYYQFEWRKSRLPASGSYFSAADFIDANGQRIYVGTDQFLFRGKDAAAPSSGQFGVAVRVTASDIDYGFYALRYNAKEPQLYLRPTVAPAMDMLLDEGDGLARHERPAAYGTGGGVHTGPSNPLQTLFPNGFGTAKGQVGTYNLVYPEGIQIYGASLASYLGDSNLAGEISVRRRMPLVSTALVALPGSTADADSNPLYAVGDTLHGQMSVVTALSPTSVWNAATFSAEIAANQRLSITRNYAALDPTRDKFAAAVSAVFEPAYFAVLPGLDISLPLSVEYGLIGRSSVDSSMNVGAGSTSFGISATYRAVWNASLAITHFIGGVARQPFADRDFISLSVQRTF